MFKIGLENRDFCKSLHFYIVDAGKKKKKKKKKTSCICWLVQLLSALRAEDIALRAEDIALRAEDIALRAMPSLFVFLVLRGACQRPDICVGIYPDRTSKTGWARPLLTSSILSSDQEMWPSCLSHASACKIYSCSLFKRNIT